MDRAKSLKANMFWQFLTNGLGAGAQLAIVTALTKLTSDAVTGEFVIAWAICTPIFMFAGLDLRAVQATDTRNEFSFVDQFAIRLMTGLLATVVSIATVLWTRSTDSMVWVVMACCGGKFSELVAETFVGLMQRHERFELVTRSTAIRALVSCVSMITAIVITRDLQVSALIWAACSLLNLAFVEIPWGRQFLTGVRSSVVNVDGTESTAIPVSMWRTPITRSGMTALWHLGFPLAIRSLLVSLTPNVARFIVKAQLGIAAVGIFGPISQLTMAAVMFSRTMNPAVAPRLSRYLHEGQFVAYRRLLMKVRWFYLVLGITSLLCVGFFGRTILGLMFKPHFASYQSVFMWAMVATTMLFQGGVLDMALVTLRRVDSLAKTSFLTLGTMCLSGWLLVPMWGLEGASISVAISWGVRGVYLQLVLSRALVEAERQWQISRADNTTNSLPRVA